MGQASPEARRERVDIQELSGMRLFWPVNVINSRCEGLYNERSKLREVPERIDSRGLPIYSGCTPHLAPMRGTLVPMGALI